MIDFKSVANKVKTEGGKTIRSIAAESSRYIKETAPVVKEGFSEKKEVLLDKISGVASSVKKGAASIADDFNDGLSDFGKKPKVAETDDTAVVDAIIDEISGAADSSADGDEI